MLPDLGSRGHPTGPGTTVEGPRVGQGCNPEGDTAIAKSGPKQGRWRDAPLLPSSARILPAGLPSGCSGLEAGEPGLLDTHWQGASLCGAEKNGGQGRAGGGGQSGKWPWPLLKGDIDKQTCACRRMTKVTRDSGADST